MSSYTQHIDLIPQPDGTAVLGRDVTFYLDEPGGRSITAPAGMPTDGASIPVPAWSLLGRSPFDPRVLAAALIHDGEYRGLAVYDPPSLGETRTRADADGTFRDGLPILGTSGPRAFLMWVAVRLFGRSEVLH